VLAAADAHTAERTRNDGRCCVHAVGLCPRHACYAELACYAAASLSRNLSGPPVAPVSPRSFNSRSSSRALFVRRSAACAACLLAACVATVALARGQKDASVALVYVDGSGNVVNKYEDGPVFDADWSQTDLQHHLVTTQRMMTADNTEVAAGIAKLDEGVLELMALIKKRPAGEAGTPGSPGKAGMKGQPGAKGQNGPDGASGLSGQQGQPGRDGVPGAPGSAGPVGLAGMPGRTGNPGARGVVGKAGPAGPEGQRGQVGIKGRSGWEGPPGPQGVPAYLHAVHHYPNDDTDTSGAEDAAQGAEERQTSSNVALSAARRRNQQALLASSGSQGSGSEGDAEAAYKRTLRLGWKKEGDVSVAQVWWVGGCHIYIYIHIQYTHKHTHTHTHTHTHA
jgi:hypothetical protein